MFASGEGFPSGQSESSNMKYKALFNNARAMEHARSTARRMKSEESEICSGKKNSSVKQ